MLVDYLKKLSSDQLEQSLNYLNYDPDYSQRCYERYLTLKSTIDILDPSTNSKIIDTPDGEMYRDYGFLSSVILNGEVYVYDYCHPEYDYTIKEKTSVGLFSVEIDELDYYSAYIYESKAEARKAVVELIYHADEILVG